MSERRPILMGKSPVSVRHPLPTSPKSSPASGGSEASPADVRGRPGAIALSGAPVVATLASLSLSARCSFFCGIRPNEQRQRRSTASATIRRLTLNTFSRSFLKQGSTFGWKRIGRSDYLSVVLRRRRSFDSPGRASLLRSLDAAAPGSTRNCGPDDGDAVLQESTPACKSASG